jgi:hypothetical protein
MTTFEYLNHLKVHRGVDCFGLDKDQLARMCEIGYDRWLQEYEPNTPSTPVFVHSGTVRCALGSKCFNASNRKGAFGTGKYCSPVCRGAAQMAKRREKQDWASANPEMVGIQ